MGHVDDAHDTEGDGEADGGQQQHRAERDAAPDILAGGPDRKRALDRAGGGRGRVAQLLRRVGGHGAQQGERVLVAALADGVGGGDPFGLASVGLHQDDGGAGGGEGGLDGGACFLGDQVLKR